MFGWFKKKQKPIIIEFYGNEEERIKFFKDCCEGMKAGNTAAALAYKLYLEVQKPKYHWNTHDVKIESWSVIRFDATKEREKK